MNALTSSIVSSVQSVLVIVIIIALGYYLRRKKWFDDSFGGSISKLIMNVALPASIFESVLSRLTLDKLSSLSSGLLYAFTAIVIGYLIAWAAVKVFKIRPGRRGIFMNTVVNANTIFVGLPLNIALFGDKSITYFLVYYVANTVSTWAFGTFLISADDPTADKNSTEKKAINWKKLLPPPLLGFIAAIVVLVIQKFLPFTLPMFVSSTLGYVGGIVTPLSLIYIGIILADAGLKSIHFDRDTILGLMGRFVLAPAVMMILILVARSMTIFPIVDLQQQTLIVQSAAPALAVLPILANEAHGDVKYATNIVTTSTILFVIVIPIIMAIMQVIF